MFRSNEQEYFSQVVSKHMAQPDAALLLQGGTGLGKTRAYLAAVASTGKRVALVLPTHTLIDQLLASSDLQAVGLAAVAFRPARMFETRDAYLTQKQSAADARVMICTAASVIIDQRLSGSYNGATEREVILFDEADQLPDMAALQSDFTIDADLLTGNLRSDLERIGSAGRAIEPETRAAARIMLEILDEPVGYASVGLDDDGNAKLHHYLPGRMLKGVSNRPGTIFISATLAHADRFDHFVRSMAIEKSSVLSQIIEPANHGSMSFTLHNLMVDTPEWLEATINAIVQAKRPTLVATTSHDLTRQLQDAVGTLDEVMIKAGAWAGLDLRVPPKSIIVPRVPYSQPVVIDGEAVSGYLDAKVTATRRLRQVIGRGLRTPDATCEVVILDGRAGKLGGFVPDRFSTNWSDRQTFNEGARFEVVLSRAERDPQLRASAFKRYGCKCNNCGESAMHRLDVHHKDPVSEGVRRTTLADVVVLCKNCHADAHQMMREAKRAVSS